MEQSQFVGLITGRSTVRVPLGVHAQEDRSIDDVEWFLSSVRFESRGKLEELVTELDTQIKLSCQRFESP